MVIEESLGSVLAPPSAMCSHDVWAVKEMKKQKDLKALHLLKECITPAEAYAGVLNKINF